MGQDTAPFRTWYLQVDALWLPDLSCGDPASLLYSLARVKCACVTVVVVSMRGMNANGFYKQPMYFHD